jgi:hypothetical protein
MSLVCSHSTLETKLSGNLGEASDVEVLIKCGHFRNLLIQIVLSFNISCFVMRKSKELRG